MTLSVKKYLCVLVATLSTTIVALPAQLKAQTYPIDCAILLCLSGGWPSSVPCARARAEFIRRITPWPVEPPLQIWRCPMGASLEMPQQIGSNQVYDIRFQENDIQPHQSFPLIEGAMDTDEFKALQNTPDVADTLVLDRYAPTLVQDRADIDISGPEFNFVRSIRIFHVLRAEQKESELTGDCNRSEGVVLGTYGLQGDFSWQRSSISALPAAHTGLEHWGEHCPTFYHRSVLVEWRDYAGHYGFEQVNY